MECCFRDEARVRPYSITFNTCRNWELRRVVSLNNWGTCVSKIKITKSDSADDDVSFLKALQVLVMALKALQEEAQSVFGSLLDGVVKSLRECGEDADNLQSFTSLVGKFITMGILARKS